MRGYSPDTIRRYRQITGMFCLHANITLIEEVTDKNVKEYFFHGRTERSWSAGTFITQHKSLLVFFRWCVSEGYMTHNFVDDLELPKQKKRLPPKLTRQEAERLLEVIYHYPYSYKFLRSRNHAIFATFLFAGLRKKELINLKLADVDMENMTIFVRQGKGGKDRIVPICRMLAQSLERYLPERQRLKKTCPEFFASLNRNIGLTVDGLDHLVKVVRKASNIQFSIHKLRHTFATLMLEGGCDIFSLSKMMGHSDIKTTTIYLAATAEHLRSEMNKHPLNDF